MEKIREAISIIIKNPLMLVPASGIVIFLTLAFIFNPMLYFIGDIFGNVARTDGVREFTVTLLNDIFIMMQVVFDGRLLSLRTFIVTVEGIFIVSILLGLLVSGYINTLKCISDGDMNILKNFISGIRRYFLGSVVQLMIILAFTVIFAIMVIFCAIPALFLIYSLMIGKTELAFHMIVVSVFTALVIIMGSLFLRINSFIWLYSYAAKEGKVFSSYFDNKDISDGLFWRMSGIFLVTDAIYFLYAAAIFIFKFSSFRTIPLEGLTFGGVLIFILNVIFNTVYGTFLFTALFNMLNSYNKKDEAISQNNACLSR